MHVKWQTEVAEGGAGSKISAHGVTQVFKSMKGGAPPFVALKDVTLAVREGEIVCLVGPSGCGKSTLLNLMAGLLPPSSGEIRYNNRVLAGINVAAGYITQSDNLLPWRTVGANVGLALELNHVKRAERERRVEEILKTVGLSHFARHYPSQLSGGMRKRATLARTFIYSPETLLMDEPFGALDAFLKTRLQKVLLELWERERHSVVFVTHDLEEAVAIGDRILVFGRDPGRIIHEETVTIPRPRDTIELRSDERFMKVVARLWKLLASDAAMD